MDPIELLDLSKRLIALGEERGVKLRILGHLAVRHHVKDLVELLDLMHRVPTHDIDFMGYSKEQNRADKMFKELGYEADPSVAFSQEYGVQRLIYHHREDRIMAEIFLDELRMAHNLDFRGRLELDSPTISLVDLLLSKLQIQQISEKDLKDLIVLLAEHQLGSGDRERIDVAYLLKLTRDDWGLYYTAKTNLDLVKQWLSKYEVIHDAIRHQVEVRLQEILRRMEDEPKSMRWKMRARIGTRVKWYQEVNEVFDVHK